MSGFKRRSRSRARRPSLLLDIFSTVFTVLVSVSLLGSLAFCVAYVANRPPSWSEPLELDKHAAFSLQVGEERYTLSTRYWIRASGKAVPEPVPSVIDGRRRNLFPADETTFAEQFTIVRKGGDAIDLNAAFGPDRVGGSAVASIMIRNRSSVPSGRGYPPEATGRAAGFDIRAKRFEEGGTQYLHLRSTTHLLFGNEVWADCRQPAIFLEDVWGLHGRCKITGTTECGNSVRILVVLPWSDAEKENFVPAGIETWAVLFRAVEDFLRPLRVSGACVGHLR